MVQYLQPHHLNSWNTCSQLGTNWELFIVQYHLVEFKTNVHFRPQSKREMGTWKGDHLSVFCQCQELCWVEVSPWARRMPMPSLYGSYKLSGGWNVRRKLFPDGVYPRQGLMEKQRCGSWHEYQLDLVLSHALGVHVSEFLDCISWCGKTHPKCGWPYSIGWAASLYKKMQASWVPSSSLSLFWLWIQCDQLPYLTADTPFPEPWNYGQNDLFLLQFMPGILRQEQGEQVRRDSWFLLIRMAREYLFDKVMLKLKGRNEEREPNCEMRASRGHRLAEGKPWVASNTERQQGRGNKWKKMEQNEDREASRGQCLHDHSR